MHPLRRKMEKCDSLEPTLTSSATPTFAPALIAGPTVEPHCTLRCSPNFSPNLILPWLRVLWPPAQALMELLPLLLLPGGADKVQICLPTAPMAFPCNMFFEGRRLA